MNDKIIRDYLAKQKIFPTDINDIKLLYDLAKHLFPKLTGLAGCHLEQDIKAEIWYEMEDFKLHLANAITFINEQP